MRKIGLLITFLWYSILLNGQPIGDSISYKLNHLIETEHKSNHFDGTIVVSYLEETLLNRAIGTANRTWNVPMHLEVRFDIASLNKSFIAVLTLIATKEGKLQLTDKLVDLLQGFQYKGQFDSTITIHQMLTHTSGLPDYNSIDNDWKANNFKKFKRSHFSNSDYIDFISQLKPISSPNQQFHYSNFAYHLLPIILETVYQTSFNDLLQKKICKPLRLYNTFSTTNNNIVFPKVVEAYNYNQQTQTWLKNDFIDLSLGRRVFSTASDLHRWALAMNDTSFLSVSLLNKIQTNHLQNIETQLSYGYGWVVFDGKGDYKMGNLGIKQPYIIHGGNTGGYKSILVNINQGKYIISILSNIGRQTNELELVKKVLKILQVQ